FPGLRPLLPLGEGLSLCKSLAPRNELSSPAALLPLNVLGPLDERLPLRELLLPRELSLLRVWPPCTSPRHAPSSEPRLSIKSLKSLTVLSTRRLIRPNASPTFSSAPCGSYSMAR